MNDVVLEWIIPYVMPAKKRLLKAVLVSLLIVLLADAVLFYAVTARTSSMSGRESLRRTDAGYRIFLPAGKRRMFTRSGPETAWYILNQTRNFCRIFVCTGRRRIIN